MAVKTKPQNAWWLKQISDRQGFKTWKYFFVPLKCVAKLASRWRYFMMWKIVLKKKMYEMQFNCHGWSNPNRLLPLWWKEVTLYLKIYLKSDKYWTAFLVLEKVMILSEGIRAQRYSFVQVIHSMKIKLFIQ